MDNNCGSKWRKWDLHLHSCYTCLNNGFSHDHNGAVIEDDFIQTVAESGIEVVGLTNYFKFCDEDFNLKRRLNGLGIKTFLNLEIRLDHINHSNQNFDYHIIFDDELEDELIKNFLTNMDVEVGNARKKLSQLTFTEIEKSAQIDFNTLIKKLEEESSGLKGKYLLGFLSRGHGSARTSGRDMTNFETVARKSNFVIHSSDNLENLAIDRDYWLKTSPYIRPLLQGSDAHKIDMIGSKYSWIKADLTFNGLRQIIFEPEDRICLETDYPDKKNDYQVIDKILFNQKDRNQTVVEIEIPLNPNLNTVIGGRSNGKSTLTNSIAQSLNNSNFKVRDEKNGSGMFTFEDMSDIRVIWKDGQINRGEEDQRDVEFLPQDYMIRIAESDDLRNKLIEDTVKADVENYKKIIDFDNFVNSVQKIIDDLVREWATVRDELLKLTPPEGDKKGIEGQLEKLKVQILEQQKKNNFSDEDSRAYEAEQSKLKTAKEIKQQAELDSLALSRIMQEAIEIKVDLSNLSTEVNEHLKVFILEQNKQLSLVWQNKLSELHERQNDVIKLKTEEIENVISSLAYEKGQANISSSETLMSLTKQLTEETIKLEQFNKFEEDKKLLESQIQQKESEIVSNYSKFKVLREELSESFKVKAASVEIELNFVPVIFEEVIDYLHSRSSTNNVFIQDFDVDSDDKIKWIFNDLYLSYNRGKTQVDLIRDILSRQWFKRNYTLKFDNDNFLQMSQGKKAFVILTLILEFSKDEKPVIIDQPEDSLDNRAIYIELTKYLKIKKKDRQIILVTHNPNVVVGADAENVIVANQHSEVSPNSEEIQFEYINGALENASVNSDAPFFLDRRGIREHVVEILEGGNEAFKKREEKYDLV
ncbi:TrlF family AAA-like ATPase [Carnobacterium maltaromaticum]|uniref:TrlF family AAA-like ATPase n=1 Tax=Carnobacterium maltaromaticum TaxID=2751 RepID=UPI00165A7932|nr:AAA family ATPase [Carnobacterium maltaromaticum]MBC9810245.1 DNA repair ATPase [Carnobacterium maltaromaticum]